MKKQTRAWIAAGVVALVTLVACSGPAFDPTGSYTGTANPGGSPIPISATVSPSSGSGGWSWTLSALGGTYTGTCTHDTSVSSDDLTCAFSGYGLTGSFVGDLKGNTWSGDYSNTSPQTGTFTLTR